MRKYTIPIIVLAVIAVGLAIFWYIVDQKIKEINDFTSCKAAGYPILETYPEQCKTPDGRTFTNSLPNSEQVVPPSQGGSSGGLCKNFCGDGICQEVVCLGEACPCSETTFSCPIDCKLE